MSYLKIKRKNGKRAFDGADGYLNTNVMTAGKSRAWWMAFGDDEQSRAGDIAKTDVVNTMKDTLRATRKRMIYLAGSIINEVDDLEARTWMFDTLSREYTSKAFQIIDPHSRGLPSDEAEAEAWIQQYDAAAVNVASAVFLMWPKPSGGSAIEAMLATMFETPVITITHRPLMDLSPWIRSLSSVIICCDDEQASRDWADGFGFALNETLKGIEDKEAYQTVGRYPFAIHEARPPQIPMQPANADSMVMDGLIDNDIAIALLCSLIG